MQKWRCSFTGPGCSELKSAFFSQYIIIVFIINLSVEGKSIIYCEFKPSICIKNLTFVRIICTVVICVCKTFSIKVTVNLFCCRFSTYVKQRMCPTLMRLQATLEVRIWQSQLFYRFFGLDLFTDFGYDYLLILQNSLALLHNKC